MLLHYPPREAGLKFFGRDNPYHELYERLILDRNQPESMVDIGLIDSGQISNLAADFEKFEEHHGKYGHPPLVEDGKKNPAKRKG